MIERICERQASACRYKSRSDPRTPVFTDTPIPVLTNVRFEEIAGGGHTCARTGAGEVWCWGDNTSGQLGVGTVNRSDVPVRAQLPPE